MIVFGHHRNIHESFSSEQVYSIGPFRVNAPIGKSRPSVLNHQSGLAVTVVMDACRWAMIVRDCK